MARFSILSLFFIVPPSEKTVSLDLSKAYLKKFFFYIAFISMDKMGETTLFYKICTEVQKRAAAVVFEI